MMMLGMMVMMSTIMSMTTMTTSFCLVDSWSLQLQAEKRREEVAMVLDYT